MARLTPDLVLTCPQVTNCLGERELSMRFLSIQHLDSRAAVDSTVAAASSSATDAAATATRHTVSAAAEGDFLFELACRFDTIDLTGNELQRLDGFNYHQRVAHKAQQLQLENAASANQGGGKTRNNHIVTAHALDLAPRLSTLILHNNQINRISRNTVLSLSPTVHTLILNNNNFSELQELNVFAEFPKLERLSLIRNKVTSKPYYRLYVIARCKALKLLDFERVLLKERQAADEMFGDAVAAEQGNRRAQRRGARRRGRDEDTNAVDAAVADERKAAVEAANKGGRTADEKARRKAEIDARREEIFNRLSDAQTNEEVEALEKEIAALEAEEEDA